jgi:hypothetical protein
MREDDKNAKDDSTISTDDATRIEQQKRRRLLSAIVAGGAASTLLPQKWSKPVVDSVMLPAHAQMSPGALVACTVTGYLISGTTSGSQSSSSYIIPATSPSTTITDTEFSNYTAFPNVAFTFATVSGTVTAIGTYSGSASFPFTFALSTSAAGSGSIAVTQLYSWVFDSTCFG